MQRIRKDATDVDYEGTSAKKLHFDRSGKKRSPEYLGEIQILTDKDITKLIRSITRDMGVSEFLIGQVVHEDTRYFS